MKKCFLSVLLVVTLVLLCAFDWPPEPYEMPRTVLTPETVKDSLGGLMLSIKAIANTGLNLLGVLVLVLLILPLFNKLVLRELRIQKGVTKNAFHWVEQADRKKNMDAIVDDRVREMEISGLARKKFRQLHPDADLEERIYQRELSWVAEQSFREKHPEFDKPRRRRRR